MKTTLVNILSLVLVMALTSCNSGKKNESQIKDALQAEDELQIEASAHNSRNSLDWDGTYTGVVPCADCEGIQMAVTIHQDHTYQISETYLGKDPSPFTSEGTFEWDQTGQKIILSDTNRHPYFVGENTLTLLDSEGNKIVGDLEALYILKKANPSLIGEKWHLTTLNGTEVKLKEAKAEYPFIQLNPDFTATGYTGCNSIQGHYSLEETNIKFNQMISTLKACPEMETEAAFLKVINATASFAFENNTLVVFDENHQKLATFKPGN